MSKNDKQQTPWMVGGIVVLFAVAVFILWLVSQNDDAAVAATAIFSSAPLASAHFAAVFL